MWRRGRFDDSPFGAPSVGRALSLRRALAAESRPGNVRAILDYNGENRIFFAVIIAEKFDEQEREHGKSGVAGRFDVGGRERS